MSIHPETAVIGGIIVCAFGALWGWWFFISSIQEIPKKEKKMNPVGVAFQVFTAGAIFLTAHIPIATYTYILFVSGYVERWR
jgi:hypothetical protein